MKRITRGLLAFSVLSCAACSADSRQVTNPAQNFAAQGVDFGKICGVVTVDVAPGPVKLQISGEADRVKPMHTEMRGGQLHIAGESCHGKAHRSWRFLFLSVTHSGGDSAYLKKLQVHVTVPEGTELSASDVAGVFHIGDTHGALHFVSQGSGDVRAGDVASADLRSQGSGDFHLGAVAGALKADLEGSGDLSAKSAATLNVNTSGSGDVALGRVSGSTDCKTSGSGDVKLDEVHGAVHAVTSGSGDIRIKDGTADPFVARSTGSGDIDFGGTARHSDTNSSGSGDIDIRNRG